MRLTLISFDTCPYVERSRIVLHEKDREFEEEVIDLGDKPDWFLEISPRGKVPVLLVDDRRDQPIFESTVINELVEDLAPEPPMLPHDPLDRAHARAWIEFGDRVVMAAFAKLLFAADEDARRPARAELTDALARVERALARKEGPYFAGAAFGLIDAVYAPIANRWEALEEFGERALLAELPRVAAYKDALLGRPSVRRARGRDLTEKTLARMRARADG